MSAKGRAMSRLLVCVVLAYAALSAGPARAAAQEAEKPGTTILTERCYWRQFYVSGMMRLSAAVLRNPKAEWFPESLLKRLERGNKTRWLKHRNIDWNATDWRDVAVAEFFRDIADQALPLVPQVHPPADWMKPDFDDARWLRQRLAPLPHDRSALFADCWNRAIYLRTTFTVTDAAKVKALNLNLTYRGGVRVFVNGAELARGHLPAGELKADTPGADYPEDAYRAYIDEVTEPHKGRRCVPDLRFTFDDAPKPPKRLGAKFKDYRNAFRGVWLNRKGWERIAKLRDRVLGPVAVPAKMLRKGTNVLAVEIRGSHYHPIVLPRAGGERIFPENWAEHGGFGNESWTHARLIDLRLTDPAGVVPAATRRPDGVQVWVEDMHNRCYTADYNQPGAPVGTVRMVGGLNGQASGQIGVGTSKELTGLTATVSDLVGPGGKIPAAAVRMSYMVPQPVNRLGLHGYGRGMSVGAMNRAAIDTTLYLSDNPLILKPGRGKELAAEMSKCFYLDHLTASPPAKVPADTCQPIWLTLKIPVSAKPGKYTGKVTVQAGGIKPVDVPVAVEVFDVRVPDPLEFQMDIMLEQSPYGIAKHYKCPLWSDEHFRLIETSLEQLARVGNDVLYIPILHNSEFGNREDSPVKWIRKRDGTLTFDYSRLDRYLDLAVKHLGKPAVISFGVMHTMMASAPPTVTVFDEAKGKAEKVDVSWKNNPFGRIPMWKAFASALVEHMDAKGLRGSMYWGHAGDPESDQPLIALLSELFPDIYWTASPHSRRGGSGGGGHHPEIFRAMSEIYAKPYTGTSYKGWLAKQQGQKVHNPLCPRQEMSGMSLPYAFRLGPDRAMHLGYTGFGRLGFDYFEKAWLDGYRGSDWNPSGIPCFTLSFAGKGRVEPSARFEALIEGIQDAEQRILIEQAIDRGMIPADLAAEANGAVLDRFKKSLCNRFREAEVAVNTVGWQERSRAVYAAAAKVAAKVGLDVDRTAGEVDVPALGAAHLVLKLRNWTARPRAWTAETSAPWLVPAATKGQATGHQDLVIKIDGTQQKVGATLSGTVTVTDVASGARRQVKVTARVTPPMALLCDHPNFNVPVGEAETREFRVVNHAANPQPWRLACSQKWISVSPDAGTLAPGKSVFVKVKAAPPSKAAATHTATFTFTGAGGAIAETIASRTFVIPPFKAPPGLPFGRVVKIEKVAPKWVKSHKIMARGDKKPTYGGGVIHDQNAPLFGHQYRGIQPIIGKKRFDRAMWVAPHHETVYALEGSGFARFAAYVGVPIDASRQIIRHHNRRVSFEIHVDGKVVVQSGLMTTMDPPRLLVVENLDRAKEMKLVTRLDSDRDNNSFLAVWANGEFYKKR